MDISVRKTQQKDFVRIMELYRNAAVFMAQTGNPNQWVNGYPGRKLLEAEIENGTSYIIEETEGNGIAGVFSFIIGEDPTYRKIEQGSWLGNGIYGTVHRLASAEKKKGIAGICFDWCAKKGAEAGCSSIRADTHQDNQIMQKVLAKNRFTRCGIIYLADGAQRIAYERIC